MPRQSVDTKLISRQRILLENLSNLNTKPKDTYEPSEVYILLMFLATAVFYYYEYTGFAEHGAEVAREVLQFRGAAWFTLLVISITLRKQQRFSADGQKLYLFFVFNFMAVISTPALLGFFGSLSKNQKMIEYYVRSGNDLTLLLGLGHMLIFTMS